VQEKLLGLVPRGVSLQQTLTVPYLFVTAWYTLTRAFGFDLPWLKPEGYTPKEGREWILVWGESSSVGQFVLQVLRYYGYGNIVATAGKAHHRSWRGMVL
jgi:NADPH:quinone reductase-like Zn-dependent oxidoreductase